MATFLLSLGAKNDYRYMEATMDINYAIREVSLKIVYYGPGLSGKTTNLEIIHKKVPMANKGKLTAIATQQDRTLFFDFMPIELGKIGGLKTKLRLFTVPGQVYYAATRKLVLQRADGVIFVADSQKTKREENIESLRDLETNLRDNNLSISTVPFLLQYNKRDLPDIFSIDELNQDLNPNLKFPTFPAVAVTGEGVLQTLKAITEMVLKEAEKMLNVRKTPSIPSSKKAETPTGSSE